MIKSTVISEYDKKILDKIKIGISQPEIAIYLKKKGIRPSSLRSVEGRLNYLKKEFQAKNLVSLIYILSKTGYI